MTSAAVERSLRAEFADLPDGGSQAACERRSPGGEDPYAWTFAVAIRPYRQSFQPVVQVKRQGERLLLWTGKPTTIEAAMLAAAGWLTWMAETIDESHFTATWEIGIADKQRETACG